MSCDRRGHGELTQLSIELFVLFEHLDEGVLFGAEGVAAQQVLHAPVFLAVSGIERQSVRPPVEAEALNRDELFVAVRNEPDQLTVQGSTRRRGDTNARRPYVDGGDHDPRLANVPASVILQRYLSAEHVPSDCSLVRFEVVQHEQERQTDDAHDDRRDSGYGAGSHWAAGTTGMSFSSFLSSRRTVRNG